MFKKTVLVVALMAVLLGSLLAQPMRYQAKRELGEERRVHSQYKNNHGRMGMGMGMHNPNGGKKMHKMLPGRMVLAMADEIDLSQAQIDKIKDIQTDFGKMNNSKTAEIENLLIDKRAAMRDHNFKEARKVTTDIYEIRQDLAVAKITAMEDIYKELSTEQIEKLKNECLMD